MMIEPKLRFKADDGSDFPDWESSTVGELFTFVTEKNESGCIGDVITNSAEHGLIPQREYFDKDIAVEGNTEGYTVIHKGDFVYNPRKSTIAPFGPFNIYARDEAGIVSPLYTCLTPRDGKTAPYLSWYFKTSRWHRYIVTHGAQGGARHDRVGMTNILMKGIPITLPSLPEQRKIASLLSTVDDVIAAQEAEVAAWEKRKKGVMQKLFSQEVRFKADDGSDFPDWESTTVGELFTFVTEKNESGRISDVITNSAEHGLIPQREYFDKDIAVEGNTEGYTVIHKGDFVYNPRKSTIAPFGPFNIYERDEVGIVSPLYTCLTPRDGETAPYLSWYFKTSRWHRYIVTHGAQGGARHDRVGMTNALMKGIPVMLPSLPEQRKIADCLASLDDVIAKAKGELDAWRELKKGLLQQMFV